MYSRLLEPEKSKSFFLFGPRGSGKSSWLRARFEDAIYIDLLEARIFNELLANPQRLESYVPEGNKKWILLDEVQKVPALLDEVHRLIERKKWKFVLTGSSARKLKKAQANLLAGRALTHFMYPLTAEELGSDFDLAHSLKYGCLPSVYVYDKPADYLQSYVRTYLQEEVQQEGLTRNLSSFSRFLEAASFSQASVLNISEVARECSIERKVVENYFQILEDLLLAFRLPSFTKRAKRRLQQHPKFYLFDTGVYRSLRPSGPLDRSEEIEGHAIETLCLQEIRALNDYKKLGYQIYYWRTSTGLEVDFVLYGHAGIKAIAVKRSNRITSSDLAGLRAFLGDYPGAKAYLIYGGDRRRYEGEIALIPMKEFFNKTLEFVGTH